MPTTVKERNRVDSPRTAPRSGQRTRKPTVEPRQKRVRDLRQSMGINQQTFARLTGFSLRAITDWESGKPLSVPARHKMVELARLYEGLLGIMKTEAIPAWLDTPNSAFGDLKPIEVIERGETDRIWRMIFEFEYGIPT
jgi:transcriptional regulator with XRE-family HTH domain